MRWRWARTGRLWPACSPSAASCRSSRTGSRTSRTVTAPGVRRPRAPRPDLRGRARTPRPASCSRRGGLDGSTTSPSWAIRSIQPICRAASDGWRRRSRRVLALSLAARQACRKHALQLEQRLLHRQPAAVAAEGAAGAQHAVAGDDDRDRVGAAGGAGGAHRSLVAGAGGDLRVAAGLAVGDAVDRPQRPAAEVLAQPPVERQVELGQLALEVEVELAPRLLEPRGRLQHAGRDPGRQVLEQLLGVLVRAGRRAPARAESRRAAAGRRASRWSRRRRRAGPRRRRARRVARSAVFMPAPFSVASFPRAGCAAPPPASSRARRRSRRGGDRRRSAAPPRRAASAAARRPAPRSRRRGSGSVDRPPRTGSATGSGRRPLAR